MRDSPELRIEYINFRALTLNNFLKPNLMTADEAKIEYEIIKTKYNKKNLLCKIPLNKQKGSMRQPPQALPRTPKTREPPGTTPWSPTRRRAQAI